MSQDTPLLGKKILVLEDSYFTAMDEALCLKAAGAEVVGPASTEAIAIELIERERPDVAVIDINLGYGASYAVARKLTECAIPFVFATGYDQGAIPPEFAQLNRLEKPFGPGELVSAIADLT